MHLSLLPVIAPVLLTVAATQTPDLPKPLDRAHAHNDYMHKRPLLDALDCGFCSVEADIHLVDGALLVAHDRDQCEPERTIEALYLDPLRARAKAYDGRIYPKGPQVTLLIDIKSDAEKTYAALHKVLESYADIMTEFRGDEVTQRAVMALISGNRPVKVITAQPVRYAAIDGRPPDLVRNPPANLVPLVSSSWTALFTWNGRGDMPQADQEKLADFVKQAHDQGRRIRFWSLPWSGQVWPKLYEAGVDLLNADNLRGMQKFLLEQD